MSKPKILIFAPREEPPETINALEGLGCELVFGDRAWQLPRSEHEDAVIEAARGAVALMGTSMRHTPISRRIMQASQRLRIVAKYTVGVDDIDTEAATELGIMVCHAPTESNCFGVAETTIAFMLSLLKKVAERDADVRAAQFCLLRRQPHLRRISRPDHWSGRPRPNRNARRPASRALACAHHRLRSLRAAFALPHPRRHGGRLSNVAAGIGRRVVPRRAHAGDALHVR